MKSVWDSHYKKEKSKLLYPDENFIRLLSKVNTSNKKALDFGCGSGRHSFALEREDYKVIGVDNSKITIDSLRSTPSNIQFEHWMNLPFPVTEKQFGLILAWGVFHYNKRSLAKQIRDALYFALDSNGYFIGSIRAASDTHLKLKDGEMNLSDLAGGYAELYTLDEIKEFLTPFSYFEIGYSERTPLGKLEERICHWFFLAKK